ncbi:unnamed protein product [Effrenium voratum]|nr:unnamed protein product [Effrenium voratum]|mmetsp:Transcript_68691/g.163618  ORF Transcript_68691/g.163618 Transcript_68691/m.163618 type:complete len:631 (+) Transcript_68691:35-1927(+)
MTDAPPGAHMTPENLTFESSSPARTTSSRTGVRWEPAKMEDMQKALHLLQESGGNVVSGFVQVDHTAMEMSEQVDFAWGGPCVRRSRNCLFRYSQSFPCRFLLGITIILDVYLGCSEIDLVAASAAVPAWILAVSGCCLAVYFLEVSAALFIRGWKALHNAWTLVNIAALVQGLCDLLARAAFPNPELLQAFRIVRVLRIARILPIFERFRLLREMRKLVRMMVSCCRALFWSFVFCFVVMTFWSLMAVELVRPHMLGLDAGPALEGCYLCSRNLDSIMTANLLLFNVVIAGDGWDNAVAPVILNHPWTAVIFIGAFLTIFFGVLNLVVAVVVDEFAEARQKDFISMAQEMDESTQRDFKFLEKIFQRIDEDSSGAVDFEELLNGARKVPEFRHRLRVMDIDESDLRQLFAMLDKDGTGTIQPSHFISALSRWLHDSKTASRFVKYNLMKAMEQQNEMGDKLLARMDRMEKRFRMLFEDFSDRTTSNVEALNSEPEVLKEAVHQDSAPEAQVKPSELKELVRGQLGEVSGSLAGTALQQAERVLQQSLQSALRLLQEAILEDAPMLLREQDPSAVDMQDAGPPSSSRPGPFLSEDFDKERSAFQEQVSDSKQPDSRGLIGSLRWHRIQET